MTERVRTQEWCGGYSRAISSYPLGKWWQLGLWRTDVGASPQHLSTLFVPHISGLKVNPGQTEEQYRWRVSLDVAHFFPSEISLRIRDGLLEVTGTEQQLIKGLQQFAFFWIGNYFQTLTGCEKSEVLLVNLAHSFGHMLLQTVTRL